MIELKLTYDKTDVIYLTSPHYVIAIVNATTNMKQR